MIRKTYLFDLMTIITVVILGATQAQAEEPPQTGQTSERPNILLIVSDDQAWGDYSFMGHPHIETPHLDTLASEGLTFQRGCVVAP